MSLGTGSRVQTLYIPEITWGVTPATPTMTFMRLTGNTLNLEKPLFESQELRQDRQRADVRYGVRTVKGNLDSEALYGDEDPFLEAVLGGTWADVSTITTAHTDVTVAAAGHTYTSVSAVTFTGLGINVGDVVAVTGFTTAGNNGHKTVTAVAAHVLTVAETLTDESSGDSVQFHLLKQVLTEGVTKRSFSVERGHLDISKYFNFRGVVLDQWSMDAKPSGIVTVKRACMGKDCDAATSATGASSTSAATTNSPMDSLSGSINIQGSSVAIITGVKLDIKNQITMAEVIGSNVAVDYFPGRLMVSGELTAFLQDSALIDYFVNETELEVDWTFKGTPLTKSLNWKLPRVKINKAEVQVTQEKGIPVTMPFEALLDSASGHTVQVYRSNP